MSTRFIFLSFILIISPIHAMKRSGTKITSETNSSKSIETHQLCIPGIEDIIIHEAFQYLLFNTSSLSFKEPTIVTQTITNPFDKPRNITRTINTLTKVNKQLNRAINTPTFNDKLIDNLAHKLHCSHETIALLLSTKQSKQRLTLQKELKKLCCYSYIHVTPGIHKWTANNLKKLIKQDVNLEFTYNDRDNSQKTPLMLSTKRYNPMFELLLEEEEKVNINTCNNQGVTLLNLLTESSFDSKHCMTIITHPKLIINQQNKRGESALLRCLIRKKPTRITLVFITIIRELLKAGADPELGNKYGETPLTAAQQLNDERVISLITEAIKNKKST